MLSHYVLLPKIPVYSEQRDFKPKRKKKKAVAPPPDPPPPDGGMTGRDSALPGDAVLAAPLAGAYSSEGTPLPRRPGDCEPPQPPRGPVQSRAGAGRPPPSLGLA